MKVREGIIMTSFGEALSIIKKEGISNPTKYEEYQDRYRFVIQPENGDTDSFVFAMNIDVIKKTGTTKCPDIIDVLYEKRRPISEGFFIRYDV